MSDPVEQYLFGKPTICRDCDNLVLKTTDGLKSRKEAGDTEVKNVWYNFYCGATTRETGVDYVTGDIGYVAMNDLGRISIVEEPYPSCREINVEGNCSDFIASTTTVFIQ